MANFHILIATNLTLTSLKHLEQSDTFTHTMVAPDSTEIVEHLPNADALITRDDVTIPNEWFSGYPNLKLIARVSASLNGIDVAMATANNVLVMNTPGFGAIASSELTLAFILALSRNLILAHNTLLETNQFDRRSNIMGTQLHGKTIGVVGLGRVGGRVAQACLTLGMRVVAYDPYVNLQQLPDQRINLVNWDELLAESDFITLHVPAVPNTFKLVSADAIDQMKLGVRIINTSHGSVVDEDALANALQAGKIAGVAVDAYDTTPPTESPLIGIPGVIHTPNINDNTKEATRDLSEQVVLQVIDALCDKDYRNVVNMPLLPGTDYQEVRPYMQLAKYIGKLHHALARNPIQRVAVEVLGEELNGLIKPITVGVLTGIMQPILGDSVSYVNAPLIAAERGLRVTQGKGLRPSEYTNVVVCQVTLDDGEEITITGTLLDRIEPHVLRINDYVMNFVPHRYVLMMGSYDTPGVIGRVGTLLAENDVNVASWHTGRLERGGQTLSVLTLDEPLDNDILEEVRNLDFIRHARQIEFM